MKLLIVAATQFELQGIQKLLEKPENAGEHEIDFLVTGVGMVATTYHLTKKISATSYDFLINVGVAGALTQDLELAEVVEVDSDEFIELGAEDDQQFLKIWDMGLSDKNEKPFQDGKILASAIQSSGHKKVSGITVNKVHGNEVSIQKLKNRCNAQVESMEGAAFLYVCSMENLPCIQLRSISNYVEKRDKSKWKMEQAIHNLSTAVVEYINKLE